MQLEDSGQPLLGYTMQGMKARDQRAFSKTDVSTILSRYIEGAGLTSPTDKAVLVRPCCLFRSGHRCTIIALSQAVRHPSCAVVGVACVAALDRTWTVRLLTRCSQRSR